MSNTKSSSDVTKFEDVRHILGDLHSENPHQGTGIHFLGCFII